jgi:hypothetical protein
MYAKRSVLNPPSPATVLAPLGSSSHRSGLARSAYGEALVMGRDVEFVRYDPNTEAEQHAFQIFKNALIQQQQNPKQNAKEEDFEENLRSLDEKEVMARYPPVALLRFQPVKRSNLSASEGSLDEASTTTNDIFVHFPPEISVEILEYLSAKDLSVASLVSRSWHYWTSIDKLWQTHCGNKKYEPQRKLGNQSWKELYYELQVEEKRKQMRREVAEWNTRHWQCRAACGIGDEPERLTRRPRPGSELERFVPIVGFKVHPNSSKDLTLDFQFDIKAAAKELATFLQNFVSQDRRICLNAEGVKTAIWRYERFMRLQAKYTDQLLIPTVEIELIWQSHLVRPTAYLQDIYDVLGAPLIEHRLIGTNVDKLLKEEALKQTAKLWKDEYGEEYTKLPTGQLHPKTPYFVDEDFDCRVEEVGVQNMYYNPGCGPEGRVSEDWTNPFRLTVEDVLKDLEWYKYFTNSCFGSNWARVTYGFIARSAKAYERFLYLAAKCPLAIKDGGMIHPTYAIDLIWHTHMLHPQHYRNDCIRWVGRMVEHIPWPDHYEENNFTETNKHWKDEFGVNIEEEHKLAAWAMSDSDDGDDVWEGWGF